MELVSAAKMRKAIAADLASRAYATAARKIIEDVSASSHGAEALHLLMKPHDAVKSVLMVVFTSDRGLCGSFNSQVLRIADTEMRARQAKGQKVSLITIGKRGAVVFKARGVEAAHVFTNLSNNPTSNDIRPVAKIAITGFLSGEFDEVVLAYSDFKSALVQVPKVTQLLPLVSVENVDDTRSTIHESSEFIFEPTAKELLEAVVPRLIETLVYQALLESNASEHSARMMNMKNATTNASDMIDDFTLMMNQVRQAGITREISEISAGKAALE